LKNQKEKVLQWLKEGKQLNRDIAMNVLGIMNITARIAELRNEGYVIHPNLTTTVNRYGDTVNYAEWTLDSVEKNNEQKQQTLFD